MASSERKKVIQDFTDLEIYQLALDLAEWIYQITANFPKEEQYNLASQVRRSSNSIGANIAEGWGRYTYKERIHFCIIARGSLAETKHHMIFSHRMKYITTETLDTHIAKHKNLSVKLNNYIASLHRLS
ncbi:four helix bundle protein [candidate division TA06 bacterium]|uniref:Four helix bundle protein n=1 Tax=candidate division TA06 bacterium TaxID=2250710 RepID=A0A933I7M1_UNCT6|nr:four helix bundle protein [candidate division TA06 bacterium]